MQCRRDDGTSASPIRHLYGQANGRLIFPLDLCIYMDRSGGEALDFPTVPGARTGSPVVTAGGGVVGAVAWYDWPPANAFDVVPVTVVKPSMDITSIPSGQAAQPSVRVNDVVELEVIQPDHTVRRTWVHGSVQEVVVLRTYPGLGHRATVYRVTFGQLLLGTSHGLRVVMDSTGELLGMLFATQDTGDGKSDALVYPAHLPFGPSA